MPMGWSYAALLCGSHHVSVPTVVAHHNPRPQRTALRSVGTGDLETASAAVMVALGGDDQRGATVPALKRSARPFAVCNSESGRNPPIGAAGTRTVYQPIEALQTGAKGERR
jgi:hypothetical protein